MGRYRDIFFRLMVGLRLDRFMASRKFARPQFPILAFHRVHPVYDPYTEPITPTEFEKFIDLLSGLFRISPLEEIDDPEPKSCFITFDDATSDFYEFAYPIMKQKGVPATLFVPTDSLDRRRRIWNNELFSILLHATAKTGEFQLGEQSFTVSKTSSLAEVLVIIKALNNHPDRIGPIIQSLQQQLNPNSSDWAMPMTWNQVGEVANHGVSIGSHSVTHKSFISLDSDQSLHELTYSANRIESMIGVPVRTFAFPMGHLAHLKAGLDHYDTLLSTNPVWVQNEEKGRVLPRISLYDRTAEEMLMRVFGFHQFLNA